MWGIVIGAVSGSIQLYLLSLAVGSLGTSKIKTWPLVVQFFCPVAGLGICAFAVRSQLIHCAVAMIAVLIGGAVINFIMKRKRKED